MTGKKKPTMLAGVCSTSTLFTFDTAVLKKKALFGVALHPFNSVSASSVLSDAQEAGLCFAVSFVVSLTCENTTAASPPCCLGGGGGGDDDGGGVYLEN